MAFGASRSLPRRLGTQTTSLVVGVTLSDITQTDSFFTLATPYCLFPSRGKVTCGDGYVQHPPGSVGFGLPLLYRMGHTRLQDEDEEESCEDYM